MAQQLASKIIMDKALQDARNLAARDIVYGEADAIKAAVDAKEDEEAEKDREKKK